MLFDWANYLMLAKRLAREGDDAALRTAISRAYYAAYNQARRQLAREGVAIPREQDSHKALWDKYRNADDDERRSIGEKGDELRRFRRQADYDDYLPNLENYAKVAVTTAENILKALKRL